MPRGLFARELTRTRFAADRQRQVALQSVRAVAGQDLSPEPRSRKSLLLAPAIRALADVDLLALELLRVGVRLPMRPLPSIEECRVPSDHSWLSKRNQRRR